MEKWEIQPPARSKTPKPIVTKICIGDYVGDPYRYAKFYHDTITPLCPPNMRKCALSDSASFFWFFRQPTPKTLAPIFTINTTNDAVSRKDVPFGVPKTICYISTLFSSKNRKFWANFRRDWKFRVKKALTMGMLHCKLPLIVMVAQWKLYSK